MKQTPAVLRNCFWDRLALSGLVVLFLAGCGGGGEVRYPDVDSRLRPELTAVESPTNPRDDYWTETLGSQYLSPEELHAYWVLRQDKRFSTFGERWLEFCLREDLLEAHRWELNPSEINRISSAPDYDTSVRILKKILGEKPQ